MKLERTMSIFFKIVLALLSFVAVADLQYSYYQFLRVAVFLCGCSFAYKAYSHKQEVNYWVILYSLTAILFNPLFPVHMAKDSWMVFNIATGLFYLASISEKAKEIRE